MTTTSYYRTAAGDHKHASNTCALVHKRSLVLGEVRACTTEEAATFAPCPRCCDTAEVATATATAAAKAQALCPNRGVAKPNRMQSTCKDCGKQGTVLRSTGALRAHAPA